MAPDEKEKILPAAVDTNNGEASNVLPNNPTRLIHQLPNNITEGDLAIAIRVLESVASLNKGKKRKQDNNDDEIQAYKQPILRPFRKSLARCFELHKKCMFGDKSEESYFTDIQREKSLKRQKMAETQQQQRYISETALRKGRVERLQQLLEDAKNEEHSRVMALLVPDGHVPSEPVALLENGEEPIRLPKLRSCYVCKVRYREMHHFYDQLCPTCAPLNWEKRHASVDMEGKVVVVTGSRVKIGYQVCLKLLRAGATVIATTRFPNDAVASYRRESDFETFHTRLHIYGLDLRDVTGLEAFTRYLKQKYPSGIDAIINNACQTVRRPRGYYSPLVEKEQQLWASSDETHKHLLKECAEFESIRRKLAIGNYSNNLQPASIECEGSSNMLKQTMDDGHNNNGESHALVEATSDSRHQAVFHATGISHSAAMSQMIILPEDAGVSDDILPPGVSDINGHQLDLRHSNSWLLKLEEVSTPEIMECMFINAIAPFVLNSRLKPLMTTPMDDSRRPDRFIINVSAMEGKFYRYKMPNHPHTNMAKAALNMMTRTSADDLAKSHRIYMNSVDTGWINDENPLERANRTAQVNNFQTPIDEIDAAARILDPIFCGIQAGRDGTKTYGKFLKDYRKTEW